MNFTPVNRHILVRPCTQEQRQDEVSILLPDDYKPSESQFATVEVVAWANNVSLPLCAGDTAVVDRSMVQEVECCGETHQLVLENYVLGIVKNSAPE